VGALSTAVCRSTNGLADITLSEKSVGRRDASVAGGEAAESDTWPSVNGDTVGGRIDDSGSFAIGRLCDLSFDIVGTPDGDGMMLIAPVLIDSET
jgi:hypothetical protein